MGTRTVYPPGTFSWVELLVDDPPRAIRFYGELFGWRADAPAAGRTARALRLGSDAICGIGGPAPDGVPRGWLSHVTVADADDAATRAQALGATLIGEPDDVPGAGRRVLLRDPQGAVVALWEPRGRIGAGRVNDVGCLCMNELLATDLEASRAFYEALLGWTTELLPGAGAGPAGFFLNDGRINASAFREPDARMSAWRACFTVESVERALARVRALGGTPSGGPIDLDHGVVAAAVDPQGAAFALFAGDIDP